MKLKLILILLSMSFFSKLFGDKTPTHDPYWEFDQSCHFKPKVSKGEFYKLSGSDFAWFILEPLSTYGHNGESEVEQTKCLAPGQKALYYWWYLDGQVTNGGFVQFYFNDYGKYIPTIIKGLEYIGDQEMADLVKKADKIFQKHRKRVEKEMQADMFSDALYEKLDPLSELDDDYYDLNDQTMERVAQYIKSHPSEFCLDEAGNEFETNFSGPCTTQHPNGKVKEIFELKAGKIDGSFKSYFESGGMKESIEYKNGAPTGEKIFYYESGQVNSSLTLIPDLKRFKREWFHENGNPEKLEFITQEDKERIGEYKEWYSNGQLKESGTYISAYDRDGEWLEFYENGNKCVVAEFKDEKFILHDHWNEAGEHILKDGTGKYIWEYSSFGSSVDLNHQEFKDYKKHGQQLTYTNDVISKEQNYQNGERDGVFRDYYNNGNLKKETVYKAGEQISEKEFPMFENPVVVTTIVCEMKDEWLTNRDLPTADSYPTATNAAAILKNFKVPLSMFEGYPQDYDLNHRYFVSVDENGKVTKMDFLSASNGFMTDEIRANVQQLEFKPAMKDGVPVASHVIVGHEFVLGAE